MKKYVGLFIAWGLFFISAVAFAAANYEENVVEAEGYGLSAAGSATEVQARLTARRAAIADAQRVLAEEMAAVQVDAETRVEDAAKLVADDFYRGEYAHDLDAAGRTPRA